MTTDWAYEQLRSARQALDLFELELNRLYIELNRLLDAEDKLLNTQTKLKQTIDAFPDANKAANLAHARAERDDLRQILIDIRTLLQKQSKWGFTDVSRGER